MERQLCYVRYQRHCIQNCSEEADSLLPKGAEGAPETDLEGVVYKGCKRIWVSVVTQVG